MLYFVYDFFYVFYGKLNFFLIFFFKLNFYVLSPQIYGFMHKILFIK